MKFKECKAIYVTTSTNKTFGYILNFQDDELKGMFLVGSSGDIFPIYDYQEYGWKANDNVTFEILQQEFNSEVKKIVCEDALGNKTIVKQG